MLASLAPTFAADVRLRYRTWLRTPPMHWRSAWCGLFWLAAIAWAPIVITIAEIFG